jgi:hypothetical protein
MHRLLIADVIAAAALMAILAAGLTETTPIPATADTPAPARITFADFVPPHP